jgi:hypothetical protein
VNPTITPISRSAAEKAHFIRNHLPSHGLFAGQEWRISPDPLPLGLPLARELESLGRVLLQFNRAVNLLYRQSAAGKQPEWIARWLDLGKPAELIELQRDAAFKNEVPRVIRPDLLLTDHGFSITELDSVPGGIGLTGWLNQTYSELQSSNGNMENGADTSTLSPTRWPMERGPRSFESGEILGGSDGMRNGFAGIFGEAPRVHIVVSEEAGTYRPEMEWLAEQIDSARFHVRDARFSEFARGDAIYRFFELFDLANVPSSKSIFAMAHAKEVALTPPPKTFFEEKMLFALLWNRNLREFWRQQLGESFLQRMLGHTPYTWIVDPAPLPPHGAIPELNLTNWHQLKLFSQKERELILKVSGFSEHAWGARGVYLGSDLSHAEWSEAVDRALRHFNESPFVLQRYEKPKVIQSHWWDFEKAALIPMAGRVRLCPYYFVIGEGDAARAHLGGVLATICPADKKIIHGMKEAILAPCSV